MTSATYGSQLKFGSGLFDIPANFVSVGRTLEGAIEAGMEVQEAFSGQNTLQDGWSTASQYDLNEKTLSHTVIPLIDTFAKLFVDSPVITIHPNLRST